MWSERVARAAAASFMLLAPLAEAGGDGVGSIVYDPTNHAETAVMAAEAVKQTAQQLRAYLVQVRQYVAELENLKALPREVVEGVLRPYRDDAIAVSRAVDELVGLGRDVDELRDAFDRRFKEAARLRLSPGAYFEREMTLATRRAGHYAAAVEADRRTLATVNADLEKVRSLQRQVPASSGALQSLQTMNQHLNLLAGQNASLLALMARAQGTRDESERQASDRRAVGARAELRALERENAAIDDMRRELRRREHALGWGLMK